MRVAEGFGAFTGRPFRKEGSNGLVYRVPLLSGRKPLPFAVDLTFCLTSRLFFLALEFEGRGALRRDRSGGRV